MILDPILHAQRVGDAADAASSRMAEAHRDLMLEVLAAVNAGGATIVAAPAATFCRSLPMREVLSDYLAGPDERTDALIALLAACAAGKPEGRLQAQAWVAGMARAHADFHADEAAWSAL